LSSKTEKKALLDSLLDSHDVRLIETIPCFCDIPQFSGQDIFAIEHPEHQFTKILQKIAKKIDAN